MGWNRIRSKISTDKRQTTHQFQRFECVYIAFFSSMLFSFNSSFCFVFLQCVFRTCNCVSNLFYVISLWLFAITAWLSVVSVCMLFCFGILLWLSIFFLCFDVASAIFSTRFVSFLSISILFIYFFSHALPVCFAKCVIGFTGRFAHRCAVIFHGNFDSVYSYIYICNKSHSSILCVFVLVSFQPSTITA